jgi:proteasome lid subunit RPN8/RPN11
VVYATRGLVDALLELAEDRDPESLSVALAATPAGDWAPLDQETEILTDFYLPSTGGSVSAVFGMDLGTPKAAGRFLTHPDGDPLLRQTDDFHNVILVAVPPYDRDSVHVYDRGGRERPLELVDAEPPERTID